MEDFKFSAYGIEWNEEADLSESELWINGVTIYKEEEYEMLMYGGY